MLDPALRAALAAEAERYDQIQSQLADPEIVAQRAQMTALAREAGGLQKRVKKFREYAELERQLTEARELIEQESDAELRALAEDEVGALGTALEPLGEELKLELLSRHHLSSRNVILEIRAGTGGDEATLFAADLVRMYQRLAERRGFRFEELSSHHSEVGGYKEFSATIEGQEVYDWFRFESGTHRVQRVPSTETQGRIHTSAATVAVLPEPEEVEIDIKDNDLRVDTFRAGGPGGQNVNKTSSAVRITHEPTGLVVICQDESSQHKNKSKAMRTLRSRLFEVQQNAQKQERDSNRRAQIGTGDRSEKIRTYNFPQDRVTDHRIKRSFHNLPNLLDGDLTELVEAMRQFEVDQRLQDMQKDRQNSSVSS